MPRLDFLLIPLLSGYIFLSIFRPFRFYIQRVEKQRLIYDSIVCGFVLTFIFILIDEYVLKSNCLINIRESFGNFLNPILSIASENNTNKTLKLASLVIINSILTASFLNLFFTKTFSLNFAIDRYGDDLEKLLWKTLKNKKDEDKLLMVTTKPLKVYVGYVTQLSKHSESGYLTIIPNFSGYRDKSTLELTITTNYLNIIKKYIETGEKALINEKMGITIPKSEIVSISKFDIKVFSLFKDDNMKEENPKPKEEALKIKGTLDDVLKVSVPKPNEKE